VITIDEQKGTVRIQDGAGDRTVPMATTEAFEAVSKAWLRVGWDTKYVYTFTWFGRPIIQLPDDMMRMQEVIWALKPDVVIETGVAHGGSLVFYASLLKAMDMPSPLVVGIDVEIRPHNRQALDGHPLKPMIELVEGSSVEPAIVEKVKALVHGRHPVLVVLDSNHTRDHVRAELEAYAPLVTPGSYIVATDGIMKDVVGAPRSQPSWDTDNPFAAASEFTAAHTQFEQVQPPWPFDESVGLLRNVTYWPGAWLRRKA
jgi:cephalosporin hydroxylase